MTIDWLDYTRERFPLYFRLGFLLPRKARPRVWCLLALAGEAEHVLRQTREPGIALIRLQWWQDRLAGAMPALPGGHPLASAVQEYLCAEDVATAAGIFAACADLVETEDIEALALAYGRMFAAIDPHPVNHRQVAACWLQRRLPEHWLPKEKLGVIPVPESRFQHGLSMAMRCNGCNPNPALLWLYSLITIDYK